MSELIAIIAVAVIVALILGILIAKCFSSTLARVIAFIVAAGISGAGTAYVLALLVFISGLR